MGNNPEIIVNIQTTKEIVDYLQQAKPAEISIESVNYANEQTSRFGLVETAAVIGILKGIEEVVKLALDIRNLLKKKEGKTVQLNAAGERSYVEIDASMTDEEIETHVRNHFRL
jgi:hypothetical protein